MRIGLYHVFTFVYLEYLEELLLRRLGGKVGCYTAAFVCTFGIPSPPSPPPLCEVCVRVYPLSFVPGRRKKNTINPAHFKLICSNFSVKAPLRVDLVVLHVQMLHTHTQNDTDALKTFLLVIRND